LRWDVDYRTTVDMIDYETKSGVKSGNSGLIANRLLLGMKYQSGKNSVFRGRLSYHKSFGDSANHSQANVSPGNGNFDWVINETPTDNTVKVREAFWLYSSDTFFSANTPFIISMGRRPSTGGKGTQFRSGYEKAASPLAHTVNVEFDGLSILWRFDKVAPALEGSSFKICSGRGLTNARSKFASSGGDHSYDKSSNKNVDMVGFIFTPFDNGQYAIYTNYAKAFNMIGYSNTELQTMAGGGSPSFKTVGNMSFLNVMLQVDGIGEDISEFLDDTKVFISVASSETDPRGDIGPLGTSEGGMLGKNDKAKGTSIWAGVQIPVLFTDEGRFGFEWNQGSKYWRSVTYAEDTYMGSKVAARGTAIEAYYLQPLTESMTFSLRYTQIDYDHAGSNAFFGADGNPEMNTDYIAKASDLRMGVSYRF
jgi:hypothetical protein